MQNRDDFPQSADYCEVSTATRLLGDCWSLLIVRELFVGNSRFTEIQEALPGLSRGLLASDWAIWSGLGSWGARPATTTISEPSTATS